MNKKYIHAIFLTLALILSACGSNEKEDGLGSTGGGSIIGKINSSITGLTIDTSNGNFSTDISVSSAYANSVTATLNNMDVILNNCPLVSGTVSVIPSSITLDTASPSKNLTVTGTLRDPNCKPTSYQVKGTNVLVQGGETVTEPFVTQNTNIPSGLIVYENVSNLKLEVLDKRVDINETSITKDIRLRVTKGNLGIIDKGISIILSTVTHGSFVPSVVKTDDAGDAIFTYTSPAPMVDNNLTVKFCLEEDPSICDTTTINLTTSVIVPPVEVIDDINYFITFVPQGGAYNLDLGARNNAVVTLIDKDTKAPIANSSIESITVTSNDPSVLKLTPEGGGTPVSSIGPLGGRNAISVLMTADKLNSGLAPIAIVIKYTNKNGQSQTRGQLFSMAIQSGEPTAFSINSAGVEYNAVTKQFEHKFIVQATDANSQPINSTGVINVSAMASFAKDANGSEILYGRFSEDRALPKVTVELAREADKAKITLGGISPFDSPKIKKHRAFVAVFGGVDTYEANGKWNIDSMSGDTVNLSNIYAGGDYSNADYPYLGMAVGYNFRDKICTSAYEEAVIVIDSTDGTYQLNEAGQAVVTLKHDAYMIGKRVMLMVNMTGLNPQTSEVLRSGEVHEVTLSHHVPLSGNSFPINKNAVNQRITLPGVIVAGADKYSVLNSTFSCVVKTAEGITGIGLVARNDPASCAGNGAAYLTYEVNASADGGTVTFEDCQVNNEPAF